MFYVKIKAGLGNQMFQYAFGRSLSIERNEPFSLDISYFSNQPERDAKREFLLKNFNIEAPIASESELQKVNTKIKIFFRKIIKRIIYTGTHTYYPSLMKSKYLYYEGHWENEKYFFKNQEIIRQNFSLKKPFNEKSQIILNEIDDCKKQNKFSVSIHIRRGDFVSNPNSAIYNGLLGIPYYEKSTEIISTIHKDIQICLFIFSDDIDWAKENLRLPYKTIFVSNPDIPDYEEIILMSKCDHHILANSTFSWWGAWLNPNPNKTVIAPKQWLANKTTDDIDLIPKSWKII